MKSHESGEFWFEWIFVNAAGYFAGLLCTYVILSSVYRIFFPEFFDLPSNVDILSVPTNFEIFFGAAIIGLLVGFFMGVAQWLSLRNWISISSKWILISTVSWTLGALVQVLFYSFRLDIVFSELSIGLTIGITHWLFFRRIFRHSGWFALIWGILGIVGILGARGVAANGLQAAGLGFSFGGALMGGLIGAITGFFWIYLLKQSPKNTDSIGQVPTEP